jgi:uncharacterized cupredoxin-like copper-binding protein
MPPIVARLVLIGLAVVLAASIGVVAARRYPRALDVNIEMRDDQFVPDRLTFQKDVRYRLHLQNRGKDTHEFTAPVFFASADIENPSVLNHERSEVVVQPGEAVDLTLTPRHAGNFDLRCADHDWDGMIGSISVL